MKQLIEDYKRRLETVTEMLSTTTNNGGMNDSLKMERLKTKQSEYRTFIAEMEKIESEKEVVEFTMEEVRTIKSAIGTTIDYINYPHSHKGTSYVERMNRSALSVLKKHEIK